MQLTRQILTPANEAEWLKMREQDLTSTEAAALFGASPYTTEFRLHQEKIGALPRLFEENIRMKWGNRLEAAIAYGVAEDHGIIVEPFKKYLRIPELRMGSSFDFQIVGLVDGFPVDTAAREMYKENGPGVMEVKNVDGLQFRRQWIEDGEDIEAPPHIEFQVQHQLVVADLGWSMIAPLVGGNTPKVFIRPRDIGIGEAICERVIHFWDRIKRGVAPEPDFAKDGDTIKKLSVENDGSFIDLSADAHFAAVCRAYKAAGADEKAAKERKAAAQAELLTLIGKAKSGITNGFKFSAGTNKEVFKAYRVEEREMIRVSITKLKAADVEATVPAYRNLRITEV
jgi:putative phage-type endonuclease